MFSLVFIVSLGIVYADHLENGTLHSPKVSNIHGIAGGFKVKIEAFPYQVSIQYSGKHYCGGSIIGEKYILTAAQCIPYDWKDQHKRFRIRYGSSYKNRGGKLAEIKTIVRHHNYYIGAYDYDIAIVELSKYLVFDAKCQPVRLPKENEMIADGTLLTVSGYGRNMKVIDFGKNNLRAVKIPKVNHCRCESIYRSLKITPRMICAGYINGNKDACSGDAGGPLVFEYTQFGIVSFGSWCIRQIYPGVYTNIVALRDWIRENSGV